MKSKRQRLTRRGKVDTTSSNHNIVETKREVIKTKADKGGDITIKIENKIYAQPTGTTSQGLIPPIQEPAFISEFRQAMSGRNMYGVRHNTTPPSSTFTGPFGQPVYHNNNNYYNNPLPGAVVPPVAGSQAGPQVGSVAGSVPPQAGSVAGSVPSQAGSVAGSVPPQAGSVPPQAGSAPPQAGSAPPQAGSVPPQAGSVPPQAGSVPPQAVAQPVEVEDVGNEEEAGAQEQLPVQALPVKQGVMLISGALFDTNGDYKGSADTKQQKSKKNRLVLKRKQLLAGEGDRPQLTTRQTFGIDEDEYAKILSARLIREGLEEGQDTPAAGS